MPKLSRFVAMLTGRTQGATLASRLRVRIDSAVWAEEVGRFAAGSPARVALVFSPERDPHGPYLQLAAFGERHPDLVATRSAYERAHKRLHSRYPAQQLEQKTAA